jgi:ADP-ribose pyrophosphatase YjhB (NUDIX family)
MMQKYIIFNKYNKVTITNSLYEEQKGQNDIVIECNKEGLNSLNCSLFFDEKINKKDIILVAQGIKTDEVFKKYCSYFFFVQASGGIVRNSNNETLFIYRYSKWDLPKGHVEKGESIAQAAIREVEEECGLKDLLITGFAAYTYHTYYMNGRWEIKRTSWYYMHSGQANPLTPQREEAIEKACWITEEEINKILEDSYPSIQHLFESIR